MTWIDDIKKRVDAANAAYNPAAGPLLWPSASTTKEQSSIEAQIEVMRHARTDVPRLVKALEITLKLLEHQDAEDNLSADDFATLTRIRRGEF